jgi:hypothetical protein
MHAIALAHRAFASARRPLLRRAASSALLDRTPDDERGAPRMSPWDRAARQPFGLLVIGSIARR